MKVKILLAALFAVVLAGVVGAVGVYWSIHTTVRESVRTLKFAVTKDFHDPESARFRSVQLQSLDGPIVERMKLVDLQLLVRSTPEEVFALFRYNPETLLLCGEVNAKNAFGAYVGYKRFYVSGGKNPSAFIDTSERDDFAKKICEISKDAVVYAEPDAR